MAAVLSPLLPATLGGRRVRCGAKSGDGKMDRSTGYVDTDNSGKGNIFAVEPKKARRGGRRRRAA